MFLSFLQQLSNTHNTHIQKTISNFLCFPPHFFSSWRHEIRRSTNISCLWLFEVKSFLLHFLRVFLEQVRRWTLSCRRRLCFVAYHHRYRILKTLLFVYVLRRKGLLRYVIRRYTHCETSVNSRYETHSYSTNSIINSLYWINTAKERITLQE